MNLLRSWLDTITTKPVQLVNVPNKLSGFVVQIPEGSSLIFNTNA